MTPTPTASLLYIHTQQDKPNEPETHSTARVLVNSTIHTFRTTNKTFAITLTLTLTNLIRMRE
eukprot:GABW01004715.1.p1 GENE.GABW01004715.1~~GABW01004715.1.p1  ORF type:complete len:63 (+),score=6.67 GABW01004715.1:225-413(+)